MRLSGRGGRGSRHAAETTSRQHAEERITTTTVAAVAVHPPQTWEFGRMSAGEHS